MVPGKETKTAFQAQESGQYRDGAQVQSGSHRMDGRGSQGPSSPGAL